MNIKQWYLSSYPNDTLGNSINGYCTFEGLYECIINNYEDVYDYLGIGDTLVRERCFRNLSTIVGMHYEDLHEQWLTWGY